MTRPESHGGTNPTQQRQGTLWRTAKAVGWGFFGVRKDSAYQEDIAKLTPLHIIGVGLLFVVLFVVALMVLVKYVIVT